MGELNEFSRTELLFGSEAMDVLKESSVIIFGIGGVGGHAAEAVARCGVGHITLVDNDTVSLTNINRQAVAFHSTVGKQKTEIMAERIKDINPGCDVKCFNTFFLPENEDSFDFTKYDYVIDAIDTVAGKLALVKKAHEAGTAIISSMGAGNKLDPTRFRVADISKTSVCPLARVMRRKLRDMGIEKLKVVYSEEQPITPLESSESKGTAGRAAPGSCSFVPSVAGLILGGEVVKDLVKNAHKYFGD